MSAAGILLSTSINSGGTLPILGAGLVSLTSDANHVLTAAEYQNQDLTFGSTVTLTASRTMTLPAFTGWVWYVTNATTGSQPLVLSAGGPGTVTVAKGAGAHVRCDSSGSINLVQAPGGGPILNPILYGPLGATLARSGPWVTQPYSTFSASGSVTAWASASAGDRIEIPDAERTWGVSGHAFTFHGNTYLVEDPFNQSAALASSWTSPVGFSDVSVTWILLSTSNVGTYWKAL